MIRGLLLLFVPLSLTLAHGVHVPTFWVFFTGILAIAPLADYVREATEHLSQRVGGAIGGLLNVTFGNTPELIIALFVLRTGAVEVVKAQVVGSIIGNSLLGLGLAIVAGTWGREKQVFKKERASLLSSMLILCVIALVLPALFDHAVRHSGAATDVLRKDGQLSLCVAGVLIFIYAANLAYTLFTHRDIFAITDTGEESAAPAWPLAASLGVLLGATVLTAVEAELVSDALAGTAESLLLSPVFLGIIVLAVIGNAAEYVSAVYFARQDRMGLVMTITVGSTIQVALLIAPLLVFISHLMGRPMDLVFSNPVEMAAVTAVALAVNAIAQDGETTWFEGVLLLGVYLLFGLAFFFT